MNRCESCQILPALMSHRLLVQRAEGAALIGFLSRVPSSPSLVGTSRVTNPRSTR